MAESNNDNLSRVRSLHEAYRGYAEGPDEAQWLRLAARPADSPVTLINFFKFRQEALYSEGAPKAAPPMSGADAFGRYAEVSMPAMERVGGRFLLVGPYDGGFAGAEEDWDLVAIGSYPNMDALLALYEDEAYQAAFQHRVAACAAQRVAVCSG